MTNVQGHGNGSGRTWREGVRGMCGECAWMRVSLHSSGWGTGTSNETQPQHHAQIWPFPPLKSKMDFQGEVWKGVWDVGRECGVESSVHVHVHIHAHRHMLRCWAMSSLGCVRWPRLPFCLTCVACVSEIYRYAGGVKVIFLPCTQPDLLAL